MVERLYSPKEVAVICQVNVNTILKWLRTGKLKAMKMARKWRVTESDLQGFIDLLKAAGNEKQ
jgi:excisionase family DNA binding protein